MLLALALCGCRPEDRYTRFALAEPSTVGRVESAAAVVGSDLYLFSGFLPRLKATRSVEAFDHRTNRWRTVGEMPEGLTHANPAVVDDEVVWLAGGFKGRPPRPPSPTRSGATIPTPEMVPGPLASRTARRRRARAPWPPAALYRRLRRRPPYNSGRSLGARARRRNELGNGPRRCRSRGGSLEPRRSAASSMRSAASSGTTARLVDVDRVHRYDPAHGYLDRSGAACPIPRSHFEPGTFVFNGRIVIVGGRSNVQKRETVAEVTMYDPATDVWLALPPTPRGAACACGRSLRRAPGRRERIDPQLRHAPDDDPVH